MSKEGAGGFPAHCDTLRALDDLARSVEPETASSPHQSRRDAARAFGQCADRVHNPKNRAALRWLASHVEREPNFMVISRPAAAPTEPVAHREAVESFFQSSRGLPAPMDRDEAEATLDRAGFPSLDKALTTMADLEKRFQLLRERGEDMAFSADEFWMVEAEDAGPDELGASTGAEGARTDSPRQQGPAAPSAPSLSSSGSGGGLLQSYLSMAGDGLRRLHGDTKAWTAPSDAAKAGAASKSTRSQVAELERLLREEREKRQQEAEHFQRVMGSVQREMARMVEERNSVREVERRREEFRRELQQWSGRFRAVFCAVNAIMLRQAEISDAATPVRTARVRTPPSAPPAPREARPEAAGTESPGKGRGAGGPGGADHRGHPAAAEREGATGEATPESPPLGGEERSRVPRGSGSRSRQTREMTALLAKQGDTIQALQHQLREMQRELERKSKELKRYRAWHDKLRARALAKRNQKQDQLLTSIATAVQASGRRSGAGVGAAAGAGARGAHPT